MKNPDYCNLRKHVAFEMSELRLFAVLFDYASGHIQTQIAVISRLEKCKDAGTFPAPASQLVLSMRLLRFGLNDRRRLREIGARATGRCYRNRRYREDQRKHSNNCTHRITPFCSI